MNIRSHLFIIKTLQAELIKKFSGSMSGRVLDIGCGTGPYKRYLTAAGEYVGMDENENVRPDILGRAQEIPFGPEYFDSVICTEVLEHVAEPDVVLREIKRVLKTGGRLYITVPQTWGIHYEPHDYYRFTKYGITHLLGKNGLAVLEAERIGGIFSMVGQRLIESAWNGLSAFLSPVFGRRWAERVASAVSMPFSLIFYIMGKCGDRIDKADALGWAVLAVKR